MFELWKLKNSEDVKKMNIYENACSIEVVIISITSSKVSYFFKNVMERSSS